MYGIYGGLAELIVYAIYIGIFLVALIGAVIFWKLKKRDWAFWWVSVMGNIFAFLNMPDDISDLTYAIQIFISIAWPVINIGWLVSIVRKEWKLIKSGKTSKESVKKIKKSIFTLVGIVFAIVVIFYISFSVYIDWFVKKSLNNGG